MQISHRSSEPFVQKPYDGPRHVPEPLPTPESAGYFQGDWSAPAVGPGYLPGKKLLKELGFVIVQGFTGYLRRDEAHCIGFSYIGGERRPSPNFQKIAAWGRITGVRPNDEWRLYDDVLFQEGVSAPAPRNDAEFRELAAIFDRAYAMKTTEAE